MDEQVLRLFADVGPHAQDALNSWVTLQWVQFLTAAGLTGFCIVFMIVAIYWLNKD